MQTDFTRPRPRGLKTNRLFPTKKRTFHFDDGIIHWNTCTGTIYPTLKQCCFNVGPPSTTLAQNKTTIGECPVFAGRYRSMCGHLFCLLNEILQVSPLVTRLQVIEVTGQSQNNFQQIGMRTPRLLPVFETVVMVTGLTRVVLNPGRENPCACQQNLDFSRPRRDTLALCRLNGGPASQTVDQH